MAITIGLIADKYLQLTDPLTLNQNNQSNKLVVGGGSVRQVTAATLGLGTYNSVNMVQMGDDEITGGSIVTSKWYYLTDPAADTNAFDIPFTVGSSTTNDSQFMISFDGVVFVDVANEKVLNEQAQDVDTTFITNYENSVILVFYLFEDAAPTSGAPVENTPGQNWVLQTTGNSNKLYQQVYTLETTTPGAYPLHIDTGGVKWQVVRMVELVGTDPGKRVEFKDTFTDPGTGKVDLAGRALEVPQNGLSLWAKDELNDFKLDKDNDNIRSEDTGSNDWRFDSPDTGVLTDEWQYSKATHKASDGSDDKTRMGVACRDNGTVALIALLQGNNTVPTRTLEIWTKNGSIYTRRNSITFPWNDDQVYKVELQTKNLTADDIECKVFIDDNLELTYTYNNAILFNALGVPALVTRSASAWGAADVIISDDFEGGIVTELPIQNKAFSDAGAEGASAWHKSVPKSFSDPGPLGSELFTVITPIHKIFSDAGPAGSEFFVIDKVLSFLDAGAEGTENFGLIKARSFSDAGPEGLEVFSKISFDFPEYLKDRFEAIIIEVLDD